MNELWIIYTNNIKYVSEGVCEPGSIKASEKTTLKKKPLPVSI